MLQCVLYPQILSEKLCVPGDKVRPHMVINDAKAPPCGQHNGVLFQNRIGTLFARLLL